MDKNLYNSLHKLELSKLLWEGDPLNIYFTYKKIKKGCYITIDSTKSYKLENILDKYKLKYKKYDKRFDEDIHYYFISNIINPKNIDFFDKNNKINHIKIGNFLGYECVHDVVKDKPCTKGYALEIVYNDDKNPILQVYAFCCIKLTINVINKILKKINKMNYYIRKYLSDKLKGQIQLSLENKKFYSR
jgi:hypothetical protein